MYKNQLDSLKFALNWCRSISVLPNVTAKRTLWYLIYSHAYALISCLCSYFDILFMVMLWYIVLYVYALISCLCWCFDILLMFMLWYLVYVNTLISCLLFEILCMFWSWYLVYVYAWIFCLCLCFDIEFLPLRSMRTVMWNKRCFLLPMLREFKQNEQNFSTKVNIFYLKRSY